MRPEQKVGSGKWKLFIYDQTIKGLPDI